MRRLLKRLHARFGPALQSDTEFIETAFREILGRNADLDGLRHYRRVLREGMGRTAVLLDIVRSEEFTSRLAKAAAPLPDLRAVRPDRYRDVIDRSNGRTISVFEAESSADFDWLEHAIAEHRYYEKPGVWNLGIDSDKRVIAEIVAAFAPARPLELGCAAGAVLECLLAYGITAEGVEISSMAIDKASPLVRSRIHRGDLLSLSLQPGYDVVFGLDVFEHLNPNRIGAYLKRLQEITSSDAFLFCNIPVFGEDAVFGTVFPFYVDGWEADALAGRPFATIHVDERGYPIHGHLTWADARWWGEQFEACGFHREVEIEQALHRKYDAYMERRSPARKSYFVFSKEPSAPRRRLVIEKIAGTRSEVVP